jgi:fibronectin-binding autotransporter adhesin
MCRTLSRRILASFGLTLALAAPAAAQTWTGIGDNNWTSSANWSGFVAPVSGINTGLAFGPTIASAMTNDFAGTFVVNSLGFGAGAPAYTLAGNPLAFQVGGAGAAAAITMNTGNGVLIRDAITMTNNLTVNGTGAGALTLNGAISGQASLSYSGAGTLILGSSGNTYIGGTVVTGGTLALGSGSAIPTGGNVTVGSGGTFNTNGLTNVNAAIGTLTLNSGGTLRVPNGSGDYYLNQLILGGGTVDYTGSSNSWLHFVGPGAGVTVNSSSQSFGAGTSRIQNDTAAPLPITVNSGATLTAGVILSGTGNNPNFTKAGGGELLLANAGNTANITVADGFLSTYDLSTNAGSGAFGALGTGTITLANATFVYNGGSANSSKPLTLAGVGAFGLFGGSINLTMAGVISETVANSGLQVAGDQSTPTLTLTAANTYTGPTNIAPNIILAVSTVANGGAASPLGAASNAPANLVLGSGATPGATLELIGTNSAYGTDRGMTLAAGGGTINVQNAGTTLAISGQITGGGSLTKAGPGTLALSGSTNNYTGGTFVAAGQLALGNAGAIPAGSTVTVLGGAQFNTNFVVNTPASAIGTLNLNGGALQVTALNSLYYLGQLVTNTTGGSITANDPTGIGLALTNSAAITINGNSTWSGNSSFIVANSTPGIMTMSIAPNVTLTNALSLYAPTPASAIRVTGGGTLYLTSEPQYNAFVQVSEARLRMDDLTGVSPNQFDVTLDNGTFTYGGPTITSPVGFTLAAAGGTVEIPTAAVTLTITGTIAGPGALIKSGPGTLILNSPTNTYLGGIVVNTGNLDVTADAQLGAAIVTVNAGGTLLYTANATTARTFNLNFGTLSVPSGVTLTLAGAAVNGGYMRGTGTFALTGGTTLSGVTTFNTTVLRQTGPASFVNFSNAGTLTVSGGSAAAATLNGFVNQGSGTITVTAGSAVNAADFQTYGTLTLTPATSPAFTELTNTGSSPLYFNGGSRTFLGTPATAGPPSAPNFVAGIDLHGQNAVVAGGLFVNNGFVVDSTNNGLGTATIVADFGALVKGAGFFQNSVITQNGGKVQAGNSPGSAGYGSFVFGPGGVNNYVFAIDDATGAAGPSPDAAGHVSGWGLITAVQRQIGATTTPGDFTWTASPTQKLSFALDTLVNPTTVGTDVAGPMADFDPTHAYSWPAVRWTGTYSGPTDPTMLDAATAFDTSGFVNPIAGTFGWSLDQSDQTLSLIYTPSAVPEPGTMALVGAATLGWAAVRARRRR